MKFDGVAYGPNRGSWDEEGQAKQPKAVGTIRWDHRAGRQFRRAIILGDPGSGKTWLLRYEARRLAQEGIDRLSMCQSHSLDQIALPIYLRFSDVAQTKDALDRALVKEVVGRRSRLFASFVRGRLESEQCTILLDAWDEVPDRERLQPRVEKFAKEFSKPQILLTSRSVGYEETLPPIPDAQELELLALDQRQVRSFVEVWFGDKTRASQFQAKLRSSAQVRGLARIPLMLGMLCRACPEGDFPARCGDLYESCLRGLLRDWSIYDQKPGRGRQSRVNRSRGYIDALMDVLGEVALNLLDKGQEQFSESRLREILEPWLRSNWCSSEFRRNSSSELIELFKDNGIIVKSRSDEQSPLIFLHRTLQEYLAARALGRRSDCIEQALARVYDPGWYQVLVLLAGLLEARLAGRYLAAVLDLKQANTGG